MYVGLGRFHVGLAGRLVLVASAPLATTLALAHGPREFLLAVLTVTPALAALTSAIMVSGLVALAHPPRQTDAQSVTRAAKRAFSVLLGLDLAHLVLALAVALQMSEAVTVERLLGFQIIGYLVALGCLGVFMAAAQRLAAFVGAFPLLARLRHLWMGLFVLVPALALATVGGDALDRLGVGWSAIVAVLLLSGAVLLMAGVLQVVGSLREDLLLTTSEFSEVSVTGEHRAVPAEGTPGDSATIPAKASSTGRKR